MERKPGAAGTIHSKNLKFVNINKYIKKTQKLVKKHTYFIKNVKSKRERIQLIDKLDFYVNKLENKTKEYETDVNDFKLKIDCLQNKLEIMSTKYSNSEKLIKECLLGMDKLKLDKSNSRDGQSVNIYDRLSTECSHLSISETKSSDASLHNTQSCTNSSLLTAIDLGTSQPTTNINVSDKNKRNRIEKTASKRWRGSVRRIVSAVIYNLSCFTHGCSTGWVSGVLGNEALTGGAWLAALPCLVALPAAPFFAVLADARGRKAGAFCICLSFIISWSLAAWCGPRGVWAARVAAGAGGAGALALAPLYCAEIAPRTRGLAAMPALACSSGILFAYAAGGVLSAHALSITMAVPPTVLLVSLIWLPETPSFLISVGRIQDAAKIICWFDGSDFREDLTDVIEQQEVKIRTSDCYGRREAIRRQDSDTFQPMLKRSSGLESNSEKKNEQSVCRELFRHRRSRRALVSCLVVLSAAAGSGAGAVNSFAAAVLRHSMHTVPHLNLTAYNFTIYNGTVARPLLESSDAGSILCGTALVLGAAVATVSVDKLGRKMLLLWSCSGITCCLMILGAYCDPNLRNNSWYSHRLWPHKRTQSLKEKNIQLSENFSDVKVPEWKALEIPEWNNYSSIKLDNGSLPGDWKKQNLTDKIEEIEEETVWAPVALMSAVLFLYNIGLGSVPYVLISEWFTINVRSLASSLLISWMWLSNFILLRYYGSLAVLIGLHGTYYICAAITLMGSLYIFFTIPETKGKSQEQINDDLDGPLIVMTRRRKNDAR